MANGFCPYLLQHIAQIAGQATPQYKVEAHGFLGMLVTAGNPDAIKVGNYDGHKKTVNVSYRQRFTKAQTDTAIDCNVVLTPSKLESTVSVANTRVFGISILKLFKSKIDKYSSASKQAIRNSREFLYNF